MSESLEKRPRGRRRGLGGSAGNVDAVAALGTLAGVVSVVLATIALHDDPVTVALLAVTVAFILFLVGLQYLPRLIPWVNRERHRAWIVDRLADRIEKGPPGVEELLPPGDDRYDVIGELAESLRGNPRLCVILPPLDEIFDASPDDLAPPSHLCQMIVQRISEELAKAPELGEHGKHAAQRLRDAVRHTLPLPEGESMTKLREEVVETLRYRRLAGGRQQFRLVPLADVAEKGALDGPAGKWLVDLFGEGLQWTFGLFYEEGDEQGPERSSPGRSAAAYANRELNRLLPGEEANQVRDALRNVAGDDLGLVKAQCAVLVASAEFNEDAGSLERLRLAGARPRSATGRKADSAVAFRWLVGRKAASIVGAPDEVTQVFDRCAVTGRMRVTREMFTGLTRDIGLTEDDAAELFDWLGRAEFRAVGFIEGAEDGSWIRLGKICGVALEWLAKREPAAYQDAQVAVERYYRENLVMNRAQVPGLGNEDLVAPGYGGLHLYEITDWWDNFYTWGEHAKAISAPERRDDAGIAVVCLFLETWWWWGDQVRLSSVDKVLTVARQIFRDRAGWIAALNEFDRNYVAQLGERAAAADQWRHVASALGFIADSLHLRQGQVPSDPILVRIYICWCFFSGDVAQQTGDLVGADGWFREAGRACGDREDDAGMRAFARYQQADTWIPADPRRAVALIRQADLTVPGSEEPTDIQGAARGLEDLSLLAYVARMHADIRWESGDVGGAFDAHGRALLLSYVYQVDQESETLPPSEYTRSHYKEMRTRLLRRLEEAHASQRGAEADAAIARIGALFQPYWAEAGRPEPAPGDDPLAGVVPPLPDDEVLHTLDSAYAATARLMLNDKLADEIDMPVEQPLAAHATSPALSDS